MDCQANQEQGLQRYVIDLDECYGSVMRSPTFPCNVAVVIGFLYQTHILTGAGQYLRFQI